MKCNKWTLALAAGGVLSLGSVAQAEEAAQNQVLTALTSTTLSGYVDASANWRVGKSSGEIPGRTFDGHDKQDGFNLNVVKLTLEKPLDEGQWSAGYKVDLVFGPDANYYSTWLNRNGHESDDFNIKQAFINFRAPVGNGIDVKVGVFDTILGYEVFESGNNPNYSRSFGYALEPTHHTGILLSYQILDNVSVSAGIANTYTGGINGRPSRGGFTTDEDHQLADQSEKTYMASVTVTIPDSAGFLAGSTFYAGVTDGLNSNDVPTNTKDTTSLYAGYTMNTPVTGLAAGLAFDYRFDGANTLTPGSNWAWAAALYATYQATEKLKLAARVDWAQGSDGTFYNGVSGFGEADFGFGSDRQNELGSLTVTADYSLWEGLITRVEGRWDRSLNGDRPYAGDAGFYDDRNVFTVALNTIYKF
jgi:hypothetical protein